MTRRPLPALLLLATITACGAPQLAEPPEVTAPPTTATETTVPPVCTDEEAALDATRSYAPDGPLPPPGEMPAGSTMAGDRRTWPADRRRLGRHPAVRLPQPAERRARRLRHRHPRGGRPRHLRRCRPPADRVSGDELRRATASAGEQRRRPRRPHDDDQLQPVVAHRLLVHVLRRRSEGARAEGLRHHRRSGPRRQRRQGVRDGGEHSLRRDEQARVRRRAARSERPRPPTASSPCSRADADASVSDDTLLVGLAAQDPNLEVVGEALTEEPYGIGVNQDNIDLVQFVNGVLEEMRADGRWEALYQEWIGEPGSRPHRRRTRSTAATVTVHCVPRPRRPRQRSLAGARSLARGDGSR